MGVPNFFKLSNYESYYFVRSKLLHMDSNSKIHIGKIVTFEETIVRLYCMFHSKGHLNPLLYVLMVES
jgi:hypothetical protein